MLHIIIRGISVAALVLVSGTALCAPGDGPTGEEGSTVPVVPAVKEAVPPTESTGDAPAEEPAVVVPPKQVSPPTHPSPTPPPSSIHLTPRLRCCCSPKAGLQKRRCQGQYSFYRQSTGRQVL
jgi:hypothetical protein